MKLVKPQDSIWTDDQWRAISERGSNLLVAAAAGSGKTAVLVERIIGRITDPESPTDVDRLLVATFTKAAADEMRQRIRDALEQELAKHGGDEHLSRQLALLNKAPISTLHSFCLEVVQSNFYKIPIDPVFRIANETEAELLKSESLEQLFEHEYAQDDNAAFIRLVDCFGGEQSDEAVMHLVLRLYEFSRSHPWPRVWLEETAERFRRAEDSAEIWFRRILEEAERELAGNLAQLQAALALCREPLGPAPYSEALEDDIAKLHTLADYAASGDWNGMKRQLDELQFVRLKDCRGDQYDPSLVETAKQLRDAVKAQVSGLREDFFLRTAEQYVDELTMLSPVVDALVRLVAAFGERYASKKQDKGLVDFNDLEHYCLAVLSDPAEAPDRLVPSEIALDYRNRFVEVLLDEYQDTNRVQETIIELITRQDGNRFMVGDVKQSIYRFRLAEPSLFLDKYKAYASDDGGRRIDLSQNFRSRSEVVDAVNYIFRQIMYERAAEIAYDEAAELRYGAKYYDEASQISEGGGVAALTDGDVEAEAAAAREATDSSAEHAAVPDHAVELLVADRKALYGDDHEGEEAPADGAEEDDFSQADEAVEIETVQVEARMIGLRILELTGKPGQPAHPVYDKQTRSHRAPSYRDIVILLRASQAWAPVIIEELRAMGIPAYADLSTGYFAATEVQVMMSLLKVIDNPLQDIPLAGVLRSPLCRLTAEQLARIRIISPRTSFFEAVERAAADPAEDGATSASASSSTYASASEDVIDEPLRRELRSFLTNLRRWRTEARQGSLSDLIWRIYRETGYYDLVGGLPGGTQRQANLRALYDRARAYEATSFRGLFRFLRFVERMQDSGADLGTARALGEQEDVVRIMTIHRSKGLEFPIVFVAGLAKMFNEQDMRQSFLLHKEWGLGPKFVDPEKRISLPSLAWLTVRRQLKAEMLAEEMRILYVALTRAREKLILVASFRDLEREAAKWQRLAIGATDTLPDQAVLRARSYADWIFPALVRHPATNGFAEWTEAAPRLQFLADDSRWRLVLVPPEALLRETANSEARTAADVRALLNGIADSDRPGAASVSELIQKRFEWHYPHLDAPSFLSKITVTEIKRLADQQRFADSLFEEETDITLVRGRQDGRGNRISLVERPAYMGQSSLNAAERGTAYHTVMLHVPLTDEASPQSIAQLLGQLVAKELLTQRQADAVDCAQIAWFFTTDLGKRMMGAERVLREQPFSYRLAAGEVYTEAKGEAAEESMLIQGVIDCLFVEQGGLVLVDYKTDAMRGRSPQEAASQYDTQLGLYARAVSDIWRLPIKAIYLYFFDGSHLVDCSQLLHDTPNIRYDR